VSVAAAALLAVVEARALAAVLRLLATRLLPSRRQRSLPTSPSRARGCGSSTHIV
jgi:hypothetical protein